jgi:hypothetical protein
MRKIVHFNEMVLLLYCCISDEVLTEDEVKNHLKDFIKNVLLINKTQLKNKNVEEKRNSLFTR